MPAPAQAQLVFAFSADNWQSWPSAVFLGFHYFCFPKKIRRVPAELNEDKIIGTLGRMSTNCECRRELGAVQRAESASSCSTSTVRCCAHSEQLNMSRLQLGVPVREKSYSRIARPQLGHAGVLPTGCSDELNKLNWGMAPLLAFLQIRSNGTCSEIGLPRFAWA